MSKIRRHRCWVAGVAVFAAGVFVPAPRWLRVTLGVIGFGFLLMNIWVTVRAPDVPTRSLRRWSPRTKRTIYAILIAGGVISAGYLLAALAGHGGLGPVYSSAELDSGADEFGNANVAAIGAVGFYMFGTLALFALPWMPKHLSFRPGPAITTLAAYNITGIVGYLIGRALLA